MSEPVKYTGKNGTDILVWCGADEMEEDFSGDEITFSWADGRSVTVKRGDYFSMPASVPEETSTKETD